jgi:hypothetical protein
VEAVPRDLGLKDADAVRKFQTEWYNYIDKKLELVTESGLAKAGFTAAQSNRPIRAKRLLKEAIDKGSKNPLVFERYSELLYNDGNGSEAKAMLEKAIALGSARGQVLQRPRPPRGHARRARRPCV